MSKIYAEAIKHIVYRFLSREQEKWEGVVDKFTVKF